MRKDGRNEEAWATELSLYGSFLLSSTTTDGKSPELVMALTPSACKLYKALIEATPLSGSPGNEPFEIMSMCRHPDDADNRGNHGLRLL